MALVIAGKPRASVNMPGFNEFLLMLDVYRVEMNRLCDVEREYAEVVC